jgi:8-oxo-dGTP pyrophosphatase MutT (NUDIX family)
MTAIIYTDDHKYLITKRSDKKKVFPGKWHVPGGGLEAEDYITKIPSNKDTQWYKVLDNALRREVKEETALDIGETQFLIDLAFVRPDGIPVLVLSYYAAYVGGEVILSPEDTEYAWVTVEEAKNYDLIDGIIDELAMVEKKIYGDAVHPTIK